MIPFKDVNPTKRFPFVTVSLIVINTLVFFYELSLGEANNYFIYNFGAIPGELIKLKNVQDSELIHPVLSIFTSMFIHGGWLHLIGNMLYLWVFGDNLEDKLGHVKFFIFYLVVGFLGQFGHFITNIHSTIPAIGASGAIAGVLGGYILLFPRAKIYTILPLGFFIRVIELPAFVVLGFWFLIQIINGIALASLPGGGVAWFAHIGGFISGLILVKVFKDII
jgi:membrane associated rhomboid family serine protease